jgi:methyl-accepting chemotaxis protein
MDPVFWLGLSIGLVAVSIAAVLIVAIPAMRELGRAAQSAEKLFDTLNRELPPTLEAIRLTSLELTELTDDFTEGVQNAGHITGQVSESIASVRTQVTQAKVTTKSVAAGFKAAWQTWREGGDEETAESAALIEEQSQPFEVPPPPKPAPGSELRNRLSQYEDTDSPSRRLQRKLKP